MTTNCGRRGETFGRRRGRAAGLSGVLAALLASCSGGATARFDRSMDAGAAPSEPDSALSNGIDAADGAPNDRVAPTADASHASAINDRVEVALSDVGLASELRLLAPLTGAAVARRPEVRLAVPAASGGARVQFCRDRACAAVIETVDAVDGRARPGADLPIGPVFWRAVARSGGAMSATWMLSVRPVADGRAYPSSVAGLDLNGDGFNDLVVGVASQYFQRGRAYVYLGRPGGLRSRPDLAIEDPWRAGGYFGSRVCGGDLDGDGFGDLVIAALIAGEGRGCIYLFRGSADGVRTTPDESRCDPAGDSQSFGYDLVAAGDLDGDGRGDVIVGAFESNRREAPSYAYRAGRAFIYYGGATGFRQDAPWRIEGPDGERLHFGAILASGGDLNGDGLSDVVFQTSRIADPAPRRLHFFFGSRSGTLVAGGTLEPPAGEAWNFGEGLSIEGDLDRDGVSDLAIATIGDASRAAVVYRGNASVLSATPDRVIQNRSGRGGFAGYALASNGDINGDGYADMALPIDGGGPLGTDVFVFLGGPSGPGETDARVLRSPVEPSARLGRNMSSSGDFDGDGYADLAVTAPTAQNGAGSVLIYRGGPDGPSATPDLTLVGMDGPQANFGIGLAR